MKHSTFYAMLLCLLVLVLYSCKDDMTYTADGVIPEGMTTVGVEVDFENFGEANIGKTRTPGNATKAIENICVLLYKEDKTFSRGYYLTPSNFTISDVAHQGAAEATTPKASFKLDVPFGKYYVVAVANMGDFTNEPDNATLSRLKNHIVAWNSDNIALNKQMLGWFDYAGNATNVEKLLTINKDHMSLQAKMRRVASKVTVRIDGSRLNENVYVYVKSIRIHNIPVSCPLGAVNAPNSDAQVIADGEALMYDKKKTPDYMGWSRVARGQPILGSDHSENSEALYFFENMQGTGKSKLQDANGDGKIDYPNGNDPNDLGFRDGKKYGTYIEVDAYYVNNSKFGTSQGPIKYRFMLGKNITTDYNAERNHHYKLTLNLNKNANDVDWHIEYKEDPGIYAPDVYYISYLANEGNTMPVRLVGNVTGTLKAEIIENNWKPYKNPKDPEESETPYFRDLVFDEGPWHGFLSLRQEKRVILPSNLKRNNADIRNDYINNGQGLRNYDMTNGKHEEYVVDNNGTSMSFEMPLYTRARNIVTASGYTGQNPYVANARMAKVKLSCTIDGKLIEKVVTILQARRIQNPTGVFRRGDNTEPFRVVLRYQKGETSDVYYPLDSEGPWTAQIVSGSDFFKIKVDNPDNQKSDSEVVGGTGSYIDFNILFNGTTAVSRSGYIKITYHNNTASHYIIVRQGYEPVKMRTGRNTYWYTFNSLSKNQLAQSPLDEGSMFKYANWDDALDESNAVNLGYRVSTEGQQMKLYGTTATKAWKDIQPTLVLSRNLIPADHNVNTTRYSQFSGITINGKASMVASSNDWYSLIGGENCVLKYGICYADGATTSASSVAEAQGYRTGDGANSTKGMRGCFVFSKETHQALFFPIGWSGYGHRQASCHVGANADGSFVEAAKRPYFPGALAYAQRSNFYPTDKTGHGHECPLFWDICASHGAIYWTSWIPSNIDPGESFMHYTAWDVNYRTYDFNNYSSNAWFSKWIPQGTTYSSDAAFVRCVYK